MDIGGVKLAPAAAALPAANRVEPTQSGTRAVATELPRDQAVRATPETAAVRVELRDDKAREQVARERLLNDFIRNKATVDPRTREIVYQSVNTRTGEIVRQFPDEGMLRLRDYVTFMAETRDRAGDTERKVGRIA
jgi:uncharacterized FlaG/YvyC family protein